MHCTAKTVLKILTLAADPRTHPRAVAHELETIVPHIQKIILIDVALHEAPVDVGAGRDATVYQHTANVDARTAEKIAVTHLLLVFARIGFAAECQTDTVFTTSVGHKLHHLFHLRSGELQLVIVRCPTNRGNRKEAPITNPVFNQKFLEQRKFSEVTLVYARHDIIRESGCFRNETQRSQRSLKALGMVAQPVVSLFQPVQTHGNRG